MAAEPYCLGYTMGFDDGRDYATGDKRTRAAIRRRSARGAESFAPFWEGYRAGLYDLIEQRADAIRRGEAPRTIRPSRLTALLRG